MRPIGPDRRSWFPILLACLVAALATPARADDPPQSQAESPLVKLLKSGRVPEERQGTIVEMIGQRGGAADLAYLYQQALRPDGFSAAIRLKALNALAEAASTRKVQPAGDLSGLGRLIRLQEKADAPLRLAAIRLAGFWKVQALGDDLKAVAQASDASDAQRAAALDALAAIGGQAGREAIESLTAPDRPREVRAQAVAALARLDVEAAAKQAASVLRDAKDDQDLTPLLAAFLNRQGGADKLAEALSQAQLPADAAKLTLRALYALGRTDTALVATLSKAAGLDAEARSLSPMELEQLIAEVTTKGDPERGEAVFRRADVNCLKCHAVSSAGGGVGPDLSALGSSSPVDYIINSILQPDQAIKEEFQTRVVLTTEGQVYHGIVVDRDDKRLVLKEATGEQRVIPADEIEAEKEGGSLMPKGLTNFMTRPEFIDLVRFLSELGKPGPYAIRSIPTIQRWRVLSPVPEGMARSVPDPETFRSRVLGADASQWLPAYAKVGGTLPLDELTATVKSPVLYLQGEIDVSVAGAVTFRLDSTEGVHAWLDGEPVAAQDSVTVDLAKGRHKLTLRVDTTRRPARGIRVEVQRAEGSPAELTVVGGR